MKHGPFALIESDASNDSSSQDESYRGMQQLCDTIQQCLQTGLVPVIHGDACLLYDGERAGILGGDTIAEGLATLWNCRHATSKISQVIIITDVAGVFTSDPKSDPNAELIRSLTIHEETGKVVIENKGSDINNNNTAQLDSHKLNASGSSHEHDVTGGLKAKLGAAVTIVQSGVNVIISQCCSKSTDRYVKGDWNSIWDVEAGTLLALSR